MYDFFVDLFYGKKSSQIKAKIADSNQNMQNPHWCVAIIVTFYNK